MATSSELKRVMVVNGHKPPDGEHGEGLFLHHNKLTGQRWCYCERCHALAALDEGGKMYGEATRRQCRGQPDQRGRPSALI